MGIFDNGGICVPIPHIIYSDVGKLYESDFWFYIGHQTYLQVYVV